jgi:hypothetical protein
VPRSPDGRTIREDQPIFAGRGGTKSIMPVTNPLERLNKMGYPGRPVRGGSFAASA